MDKSKIYLDKETLEREEQEAKERGMTIFQLRRCKKLSEIKRAERRKQIAEYKKKKKLEREKQLRKEKKQKEKERKEQKIAKEKEKAKLLKKKEAEKAKKEKEKLIKKRKPGRPKKLGRKKKQYHKKKKTKKKINTPPKRFDYKIIACRNGRQTDYIGKYTSTEDAYEALKALKAESDKVIFPTEIHHRQTLKNAVYEYLLLERKNEDTENAFLRNEYGKLIEHKTTSDVWAIVDKMEYNVEEHFWVWGYNNRSDRKDFQWIYDNILLSKIETEYDMIRVILFKNKIIIKDDDNNIDLILCKTMSDAIKFYNKLEEFAKRDKLKQIIFLGSYNKLSEKRDKLIDELMELTGWTRYKILMTSTSKHTLN